MVFDFQGSIDDINERQLAFIQKVLEERGYNNTKVMIDPVGVDGDNYMASVKRISVTNEKGEFKMIGKIAPNNQLIRMTTNTEKLFKNERLMYTEILPKFQELEKIAGIPFQERFRFATCYGSLLEPPNEIILLEDLRTCNFTMMDRFKPLPNKCVKSILKNLAKLHSLSFALKNKEPDSFKSLKYDLFDVWSSILTAPGMIQRFQHIEQRVMLLFEGEKYKNFFKDSIVNGLMLAAKMAKTDADSKYSVIQQGDSWTNNIMFRFEGDSLQESIMIDYQISKEANPTCDIQYLIFNCTDHESRLEHFQDWIDYYHSELDKYLSNFGLKANYVFPRDQLDADMKRYAKISFGQSVFLATLLCMKSEDVTKAREMIKTTNKTDLSMTTPDSDQTSTMLFKKRLQDLVDSHVKFGFL